MQQKSPAGRQGSVSSYWYGAYRAHATKDIIPQKGGNAKPRKVELLLIFPLLFPNIWISIPAGMTRRKVYTGIS
jgi:hypothetical protein